MSWKEVEPMSERVKFIGLYKSGQRTVAGLCREFGISRKTAYKWIGRFEEEGLQGLEERSRAPHSPARQTSREIRELLVAARKAHPTWGPRKLKAWLEDRDEALELPYPSTIGDLLKREGLVASRRRRRRLPLPQGPLAAEARNPNEQWNADFKGEFRMGNGVYCYPLTISDDFSRYLVRVRALEGTGTQGARRCFEGAFREYGLPWAIQSDNGTPFASTAVGRLSKLSVWWIRLGIRPITIRLGKPQDNGRHERMHRTLKAETTRPPATEQVGQQKRFDSFRREYNQERPHEALGQRPPAKVYRPSPRPYPERIPEVEYPGHYEVRKVVSGGTFMWHCQPVFVSESLEGEHVGLVEIEDGLWKVWFAGMELGVVDEVDLRNRKTGKVLPMSPV